MAARHSVRLIWCGRGTRVGLRAGTPSSSLPFCDSSLAGKIHAERTLAAPTCPWWGNKEAAALVWVRIHKAHRECGVQIHRPSSLTRLQRVANQTYLGSSPSWGLR